MIIAGGNPAAVLQAVDAALYEVAQAEDRPADAALDTAVPLGGDLQLAAAAVT